MVPSAPPPVARPPRRRGRPPGPLTPVDPGAVVDAAARAIAAIGPDTTMDAIAAEAAITKPILYRTIGDKAALTFALSERFVDRLSVATAAAQQGVTEPRAQFRASVHAYLATIDEHRNMFLFVNGSEYGTPLFCRLVERSARDLVGWLTAVRTRAGLDPAGARSWAYAIVGSLQMVGTMWLRERTCTLDELADDLTRLMWDGLDRSIRVQREPPSDR